jgi:ERCC4-type nuclease
MKYDLALKVIKSESDEQTAERISELYEVITELYQVIDNLTSENNYHTVEHRKLEDET